MFVSLVHISQTPINSLDTFILLDVLAEGTMTKFHVRHLKLIQHEEMAAILAHMNWNIRRDVLKIPAWIILIKVAVVDNVDLLKSHRFEHELINLDRFVLLRHLLIHQIQQLQRESILQIVSLLCKVHHLLLILIPLGDRLLSTAFLLGGSRLIFCELGLLGVGLKKF